MTLHTWFKTWISRPKTWSALALQIDAEKHGDGRKTQSAATDWATENPVWATENPVTLTVSPQTHTLRTNDEGLFRVRKGKNSEQLTNNSRKNPPYAPNCQNRARHACVICGRGDGRWVWRAFSRLTDVKECIAHSSVSARWCGSNRCFVRI